MPNAVTPDRYAVNRQYKSSIFAMLFGGEKELLELYNAINGTSYTDPSLLPRQHAGKCHLSGAEK